MNFHSTEEILSGLFKGIYFSFFAAFSFRGLKFLPSLTSFLKKAFDNGISAGQKKAIRSIFSDKEEDSGLSVVADCLGALSAGIVYSIYQYSVFDGVFRSIPLFAYIITLILFSKLIKVPVDLLGRLCTLIIYLLFSPIILLFRLKNVKNIKKML